MTTAHIGWIVGGSLVAFEAIALVLTTAPPIRRFMVDHWPTVTKHLSVGVKTTSYRVFAGLDTFLLGLLVTGSASHASAIVGFELATKYVLYYTHEYVWNMGPLTRFVAGEHLTKNN